MARQERIGPASLPVSFIHPGQRPAKQELSITSELAGLLHIRATQRSSNRRKIHSELSWLSDRPPSGQVHPPEPRGSSQPGLAQMLFLHHFFFFFFGELNLIDFFIYFFFPPVACRSSQTRGWTWATAAMKVHGWSLTARPTGELHDLLRFLSFLEKILTIYCSQ